MGIKNYLRESFSNKDIAFLHVGKTGGTFIKSYFDELESYGINIARLNHSVKLVDIPRHMPYFFSIREPASRFLSAFYYRKREAYLQSHSWSKYEVEAFDQFEHANDLAEALFSKNEIGMLAAIAIKSIPHAQESQIDWFSYVSIYKRPPLWILRQENLEDDFEFLLAKVAPKLRIKLENFLPRKNSEVNRTSYTDTPEISTRSLDNLKNWYAQDYVFYDLCKQWLIENS
jgi:hypothetical protein